MLAEIAPGIDPEKDIFANMGFKPIVSSDSKRIPAGIFRPLWGRLKYELDADYPRKIELSRKSAVGK
jgi:acyl CoA:acetate/3-ketoacid CoA transferase